MNHDRMSLAERITLLRASGVPVNAADENRVSESVAASLKSLESAVKGSLFDTEPQTFDVVMRKLAQKPSHG
jgi:hypothetical protein